MSSLNAPIAILPSASHVGGVVTVGELLVWALSEAGHTALEANPNVLNGLLEFAARKS
jgi:hypothetical protein